MKSLQVLDTDPMARSGIYDGEDLPKLASEVYHSSSRISRSDLVDLKLPNTPADFMHNRSLREPPTAAMVRGSALHTAILEPHLFDSEFAILPLDSKRKKNADKEAVDAFIAQAHADSKLVVGWDYNQGQLALSEAKAVIEVSKAVREDEYVQRILQGPGLTEVSVAWDVDGVGKRARIDRTYYGSDGPVAVDLKSAGQRGGAWGPNFARDLGKRELQMQAGHYLEGLTASTGEDHSQWLFVVYECVAPFKVALHPLRSDAIEQGRRECQAATELFKRCRDEGQWPGYPRDFEDLGLPPYKREAI